METPEELQYWGVRELIEYILELQEELIKLKKEVRIKNG